MGVYHLALAVCLVASATFVAGIHFEQTQVVGRGVDFDYFYLSLYVLGTSECTYAKERRLIGIPARLIITL